MTRTIVGAVLIAMAGMAGQVLSQEDKNGADRAKAAGAPSLEGTLVGISLDGYINVKTGGEVKAVTLLKTTEQVGKPGSGATVRVWLEEGSKTRAARVEFKEEKKERKDRRDPNRNRRRGVNRRIG
jgi:hypothetical protein